MAGQQTTHLTGAAASEYLAAIIESSDDAIISKDLNGIITSWNRAAERMFGYTAEEIVGRPISTLAAPEVVNEMPTILERIRRGERVNSYEAIRMHKNGQRIIVALTVSPLRDASGQVIGASKIARDINDRKRLERERDELLERERAGREAAELAMALHREAERNLTLLVDASDRLLGSLEVAEVVSRTLELAQRFVIADAYAVWRSNPDAGTWRVVDSVGLSDGYSREGKFDQTTVWSQDLLAIEDLDQWEATASRRSVYENERVRSLMAAPMRIHGELTGTLTFYFRSRRKFTETERHIATALGNLAASALSSAEAYQEQKRLRHEAQTAAARSEFLGQASATLSSSLHFEVTLRSVARLAVPGFADWCAVDMVTPAGGIERLAVEHIDPAKIELAWRLWERYPPSADKPGAVQKVLLTGKSELFPDITDEMLVTGAQDEDHLKILREVGLSSVMMVPIMIRGKAVGVISFVAAESGRRYSADDLGIAEQLAVRAALAIDNANLFAASERDRAESRAAVEALRESNSELEQFAYVSSHDLQEPLRTVASYTQLLARQYRGRLGPDADDFIGFIVDGAVRMSRLIDGLLTYSRLTRDGGSAMEPFNAELALAAASRNLTQALKDSHAVLTHDPLPTVLADGTQLIQVFQNLIGNAIKYRGDQPPHIHVSAKVDGAGCTFSVSDNGIGIAKEYWERIFGLFKRLHGRDIPGTGIGLATCKKIVEQHGGRIWLNSEQGKGTTFYFTLPPAQEA